MSSPDILFKGIPRGPTRGYTARVIGAFQPKRIVVPCTGSFSLAYIARGAGISPDKITTGDISLYSTALGYAIMDTDWRLEVKKDNERAGLIEPYLTDTLSKAAAVLFMVRVLQYDKKNQKVYHRDRQQNLIDHIEESILQLKDQIMTMRDSLGGLRYVAQDMWITLEEYRSDPDAILLVNPPRYTGGYNRMFNGIDDVFDWDEPEAVQFKEADYARLMEILGQSEAHTLMYYATQGEDPSPLWGDPWRAVFADKPGNSKHAAVNWIIANKTETAPVVSRTKINEGKAKYPLFAGELKPDSDLRAVRVEKQVGDYYRDLFIHKLPGSHAEVYMALLLDGYLLGVVGVSLQNLRTGGGGGKNGTTQPANLTFCFSVPHDVYKRLHKLSLLYVVSKPFWVDMLSKEKDFDLIGTPKAVQTTMLTSHPENKTARGILSMQSREQQSDGTYKLSYYADVVDRSAEETVQLWFKKFGTLQK